MNTCRLQAAELSINLQKHAKRSAAGADLQKHMKRGEFLFELIYPKEKDGQLPARSPSGRYRVKLFILVSTTTQCDSYYRHGGAAGTYHQSVARVKIRK
jgi:hypothetical protein